MESYSIVNKTNQKNVLFSVYTDMGDIQAILLNENNK